ncbi:uncharacterized protein LOC128993603 isoform X1 [Macrosteles quadrilineatus]|uniref:uncharacterized protein LOC128993603 isoform X1 n=1 Tax=Macrosteles quadrilineatus TaxID=74068 RepID=UPI0023E1C0A2|nr:uncharacterized protein LOC128993603 isoform X1 [Macrosteles quadrilineatus]
MEFPKDWDLDKYKSEYESEEHWELRKKFMETHKNKFPEDKLVCLARVFFNIEFLGCRYPDKTMKLIAELSAGVADDYREKKKGKLKRTFVQASDAAEAKIKRTGSTSTSTTQEPPHKLLKTSFHPSTNHWNSCSVHESVMKHQDKGEFPGFVIYESVNCKCPISLLSMSVHKSKMWKSINFDFPESKNSPTNPERFCEVSIDGKVLASGVGIGNKEAKKNAAINGLKKLRETCYTIQEKVPFSSGGDHVSKDTVVSENKTPETLPMDNIGSKMMLRMGWTGSGLGKNQQGIKTPIQATNTMRRAGFGHMNNTEFRKKFKVVLMDYMESDTGNDLVFAPDFSKEERKILHELTEAEKEVEEVEEGEVVDEEEDIFGFSSNSEIILPCSSDDWEDEEEDDGEQEEMFIKDCEVCDKLKSVTGEENDDVVMDSMWGTCSDTSGLVEITEYVTNKSPSQVCDTGQGYSPQSSSKPPTQPIFLPSTNKKRKKRKNKRFTKFIFFLPDGSKKQIDNPIINENKEIYDYARAKVIGNSNCINISNKDLKENTFLREFFPEYLSKVDLDNNAPSAFGSQNDSIPHSENISNNDTSYSDTSNSDSEASISSMHQIHEKNVSNSGTETNISSMDQTHEKYVSNSGIETNINSMHQTHEKKVSNINRDTNISSTDQHSECEISGQLSLQSVSSNNQTSCSENIQRVTGQLTPLSFPKQRFPYYSNVNPFLPVIQPFPLPFQHQPTRQFLPSTSQSVPTRQSTRQFLPSTKQPVPTPQFLPSTSQLVPTPQFPPSTSQSVPTPQFLPSTSQPVPTPQFPPSRSQAVPTPQFLPSMSQSVPTPQFLPSMSQSVPAPQFLPSTSQLVPTPQFPPSTSQSVPTPQFLPSTSQSVPTPQFPPSRSQSVPKPQFPPSRSQSVPKPQFLPSTSQSVPTPQFLPSMSQSVPTPQFPPSTSQSVPTPQFLPSTSQSVPNKSIPHTGNSLKRYRMKRVRFFLPDGSFKRINVSVIYKNRELSDFIKVNKDENGAVRVTNKDLKVRKFLRDLFPEYLAKVDLTDDLPSVSRNNDVSITGLHSENVSNSDMEINISSMHRTYEKKVYNINRDTNISSMDQHNECEISGQLSLQSVSSNNQTSCSENIQRVTGQLTPLSFPKQSFPYHSNVNPFLPVTKPFPLPFQHQPTRQFLPSTSQSVPNKSIPYTGNSLKRYRMKRVRFFLPDGSFKRINVSVIYKNRELSDFINVNKDKNGAVRVTNKDLRVSKFLRDLFPEYLSKVDLTDDLPSVSSNNDDSITDMHSENVSNSDMETSISSMHQTTEKNVSNSESETNISSMHQTHEKNVSNLHTEPNVSSMHQTTEKNVLNIHTETNISSVHQANSDTETNISESPSLQSGTLNSQPSFAENNPEDSRKELPLTNSQKLLSSTRSVRAPKIRLYLSDNSTFKINTNHLKHHNYFLRLQDRERSTESCPPPEYSDSSSDESETEWVPKTKLFISEPESCSIDEVHVLRRRWEEYIVQFSSSKRNPFAKKWQTFIDCSSPDERIPLCQKWKIFMSSLNIRECLKIPNSILKPAHELVGLSHTRHKYIAPLKSSLVNPSLVTVYSSGGAKLKIPRGLIVDNTSWTGNKGESPTSNMPNTSNKKFRDRNIRLFLADGSAFRIKKSVFNSNKCYNLHQKVLTDIKTGVIKQDEMPPPIYSDSSTDEEDSDWIDKSGVIITEPDDCEIDQTHILRRRWEKYILMVGSSKRNPVAKLWRDYLEKSPKERKPLCQKWKDFMDQRLCFSRFKVPDPVLQEVGLHETLATSSGREASELHKHLQASESFSPEMDLEKHINSSSLTVVHAMNPCSSLGVVRRVRTKNKKEKSPDYVTAFLTSGLKVKLHHSIIRKNSDTETNISSMHQTTEKNVSNNNTETSIGLSSMHQTTEKNVSNSDTETSISSMHQTTEKNVSNLHTEPNVSSMHQTTEKNVLNIHTETNISSMHQTTEKNISNSDTETSISSMHQTNESNVSNNDTETSISSMHKTTEKNVSNVDTETNISSTHQTHEKNVSNFHTEPNVSSMHQTHKKNVSNIDTETNISSVHQANSDTETNISESPSLQSGTLNSQPSFAENNPEDSRKELPLTNSQKLLSSTRRVRAPKIRLYLSDNSTFRINTNHLKLNNYFLRLQDRERSTESCPPPEYSDSSSDESETEWVPKTKLFISEPESCSIDEVHVLRRRWEEYIVQFSSSKRNPFAKKWQTFIDCSPPDERIPLCQKWKIFMSSLNIRECLKIPNSILKPAHELVGLSHTRHKYIAPLDSSLVNPSLVTVYSSGGVKLKIRRGLIVDNKSWTGNKGESPTSNTPHTFTNTFQNGKIRLFLADGSVFRIKKSEFGSNKRYDLHQKVLTDIKTGVIKQDEMPPPIYSDSSTDEEDSDWVDKSGVIITEPDDCEIDKTHILRRRWERYILMVGSSKRNPVAKLWRDYLENSPKERKPLCQKWKDFMDQRLFFNSFKVPDPVLQEVGLHKTLATSSGSETSELHKHLQASESFSPEMDLEKHINSSSLTVVHAMNSSSSHGVVRRVRTKNKKEKSPDYVTAFLASGHKVKLHHSIIRKNNV